LLPLRGYPVGISQRHGEELSYDKRMIQANLKIIKTYLSEVGVTLDKLPVEAIAQVVEVLDGARTRGGRVYIFGNGGSAATASHFASDLSKGAICEGKPRIKAFALTENVPLFSAWANDISYESQILLSEPRHKLIGQ